MRPNQPWNPPHATCAITVQPHPLRRCTYIDDPTGRMEIEGDFDGDPALQPRRIGHARPTNQPLVDETIARDEIEARADVEAAYYAYHNTWVPPYRDGILDRPFTENPEIIPSAEPITLWENGRAVTDIDAYNEDPACYGTHQLRATRTGESRGQFVQRTAYHQLAEAVDGIEAPSRGPVAPLRGVRTPGYNDIEQTIYQGGDY